MGLAGALARSLHRRLPMGAAWGVAGLAWLWLAAATGDGRPVHEARRVPSPTARAGTPRTHRHRAPKAPRRRARKVTPSAARHAARTDPPTPAGAPPPP